MSFIKDSAMFAASLIFQACIAFGVPTVALAPAYFLPPAISALVSSYEYCHGPIASTDGKGNEVWRIVIDGKNKDFPCTNDGFKAAKKYLKEKCRNINKPRGYWPEINDQDPL